MKGNAMGGKYRQTEESLRAERDKYKALAQPQLNTRGLERLFSAARKAAIDAVATLEADEREAIEKSCGGVKIEDAIKRGWRITMNLATPEAAEALNLNFAQPEKKKKRGKP